MQFPNLNVKKAYPLRDCGCAGKGKHKADCPLNNVIPNPITSQPTVKPTVPVTNSLVGLGYEVPEEKQPITEYPDGYKYIEDNKIVLIMVNQHTTSKYCSKFNEVVSRTVKVNEWYSTHQPNDNWVAILPELFLERAVEGFDYCKVTIEPFNPS